MIREYDQQTYDLNLANWINTFDWVMNPLGNYNWWNYNHPGFWDDWLYNDLPNLIWHKKWKTKMVVSDIRVRINKAKSKASVSNIKISYN